jgi:hypothetical protein
MQRPKQATLKLPSFVLEYDGGGGSLCSQRNTVKRRHNQIQVLLYAFLI